ncbi:hypothetical protein DESUT3_25730 [Desulfuromonas versatilis]|uniref:LPXTG cell wall anchor domain-containing protein n=1 Tax=Desulfuromonas versatilis TaxID=2802975 RepID=A0ABN6DZW0_9BACT|nr:hypothetical protein [Desulfuromonas versatilis]BCR05504.1 hypothetical protein DESUT3_25730 [Desulfuromonas versatilis]
MKRGLVFGAAALATGLGAAGTVFCYNLWSFCCGRCTTSTLMTLGPFGTGLIGLSLAAGGLLLALKLRTRRRISRLRCGCGVLLVPEWRYCPDCGCSRQPGRQG